MIARSRKRGHAETRLPNEWNTRQKLGAAYANTAGIPVFLLAAADPPAEEARNEIIAAYQ
jgi:hypothetical protein